MKTTRIMWLKHKLLLVFILLSTSAHASKMDILTGGYSLAAKTSQTDGSTTGAGAYRFNYGLNILKGLDIAIGYTLIMSQVIGGDMGFGFDLGFEYFPLTPSTNLKALTTDSMLSVKPLWRPFVGTGFSQRQFQSVSTNYAGFHLSVGVERALEYGFDFKGILKYSTLTGPQSASATEIIIGAGITFPFSLK